MLVEFTHEKKQRVILVFHCASGFVFVPNGLNDLKSNLGFLISRKTFALFLTSINQTVAFALRVILTISIGSLTFSECYLITSDFDNFDWVAHVSIVIQLRIFKSTVDSEDYRKNGGGASFLESWRL